MCGFVDIGVVGGNEIQLSIVNRHALSLPLVRLEHGVLDKYTMLPCLECATLS